MIAWSLSAALACGIDTDVSDGQSGVVDDGTLHMMVDAETDTDVEAVAISLETCDGEEVVADEVALEALTRRTLVPAHAQQRGHLFVEEMRSVEPGCYELEVQLVGADARPIEDCSPAVGHDIEVREAETTEVVVFSRCHEAELHVESLRFEPGFRVGCGESVEVCATVDGRGADVETRWEGDGTQEVEPTSSDFETGGEGHDECVDWPIDDHGEHIGSLEAYRARAEAAGESHEVGFTTYRECPEGGEIETVEPPSGSGETRTFRRIDR